MIKVRILISMFQVLRGVATTFNISYPESYKEMLRWLATFELVVERLERLGGLVGIGLADELEGRLPTRLALV